MIQLLYIFTAISSALGAGEFSVLHHPPGLLFRSHDHLRESTLTEVYSAALGFSTEHYTNWLGIFIETPFDLAEAIVTVSVDGVADIGQQNGHHFPLKTDLSEKKVYQTLVNRILMHYPEQNTNIVRIDLSNGLEDVRKYDIFEKIHNVNPKFVTPKALSVNIDEDRKFLEEVALLHEIAEKIEGGKLEHNNIPDLFWFHVTALHALADLHGENSTETMEAKLILNEAILRLNVAFKNTYKGAVLVNVITSDVSHTRRGRSILEAETNSDDISDEKETYNLASYYNKDYPAIFNIILWFGVMMLFSLIAICLAIGNMDPGRDSIIYRMTSTRMKKDN